MAFVLDKVSEDTFYENVFLGLTKILEKNRHIKHVYLERHSACPVTDVALWEQINCLKLPDDLRDFYLASNGLNLTWNYAFSGKEREILPVGLLKIRSLQELIPITKANLQVPGDLKPLKNKLYQQCNADARAVYLANVDDTSKVCLVYSNNSRIPPNIFLLENDSLCYYLTNSFKKYFLMAIAHLGLPMWQFSFTPQGMPSWVEQLFNMNAPHLEVSQPVIKAPDDEVEEDMFEMQTYQLNKVDSNIFKSKHRSNKNGGDILKYRNKKH